jgi:hypothetical protein
MLHNQLSKVDFILPSGMGGGGGALISYLPSYLVYQPNYMPT